MEQREFGNTGVKVSVLGFGGAEIGFEREEAGDAAIERLLNALLDAGVTFFDTAECYADSEELIGRFLGHRRGEFFLSTKIGHEVTPDAGPEWSVSQLEATVDRGLARLRTDRVDVIHLHTCSKEDLERGDVIDVLIRARNAGKTRFIAYSGDNEAAEYAVACGAFDSIQTSFSVLDQKARKTLLGPAGERGMGVVIKRPSGNAMVGASAPWSDYSRPYFERAQAMKWPAFEMPPIEMSLRYTLSFPISTLIAGTKNPDHALQNVSIVEKGPLPQELVEALNAAWDDADEGWDQKS